MSTIWFLVKESWIHVTVAIITGLIGGFSSVGVIALINDTIIQDVPRISVVPFISLTTVLFAVSVISQFLLIDFSQDTVYKLRLQLSQQILATPLQRIEQLGASQLLAILTKDIQSILDLVLIIPNFCINLAIVAGCILYLGWLSAEALVLVMTFFFLIFFVSKASLKAAHGSTTMVRRDLDHLYDYFRDLTKGNKELKLHSRRRKIFFHEDLQTSASDYRVHSRVALKLFSVTTVSSQSLFLILIGLLSYASKQLFPSARSVLPAYVLTLTFLLGPIINTIRQLPLLAAADVALAKVRSMNLSPVEDTHHSFTADKPVEIFWEKLELIDLFYSYKTRDADSSFSIGPINLVLNAGEIIFITGGNGSGKSTLAKIITGLYVPDSGKIKIDGKLILEDNRQWYRQFFSAVFSDFHLFKRLVSTNDAAIDVKAASYLKKLKLDEKVSVRNSQISTIALSQGQRKRLALLSAYIEDRPIYLFDEWAADQDPIFKHLFYMQILPELKALGKTIIVISHDEHYFRTADTVVEINYGSIESVRENLNKLIKE